MARQNPVGDFDCCKSAQCDHTLTDLIGTDEDVLMVNGNAHDLNPGSYDSITCPCGQAGVCESHVGIPNTVVTGKIVAGVMVEIVIDPAYLETQMEVPC